MHMYTFLLLDDEPLIIESLKDMIPWRELDCTCIGEATDGIRGIELIEKCREREGWRSLSTVESFTDAG